MDDVLTHHGILGMKWGVRRSQEELDRISGRKAEKKALRESKKERKEIFKKASQLSDDELDAYLRRFEKESRLKQYLKSDKSPGNDFVKKSLEQVGSKAISAVVVGTIAYAGKTLLSPNAQGSFNIKDLVKETIDRFSR